jgi:hypothetical protein
MARLDKDAHASAHHSPSSNLCWLVNAFVQHYLIGSPFANWARPTPFRLCFLGKYNVYIYYNEKIC